VYLAWCTNVPSFDCLICSPRKNCNSPIMLMEGSRAARSGSPSSRPGGWHKGGAVGAKSSLQVKKEMKELEIFISIFYMIFQKYMVYGKFCKTKLHRKNEMIFSLVINSKIYGFYKVLQNLTLLQKWNDCFPTVTSTVAAITVWSGDNSLHVFFLKIITI
jgi:hypothetical protein